MAVTTRARRRHFPGVKPWESRCWCTTYHDIQIYILDFIVYQDIAWVLYRPTYKMLLSVTSYMVSCFIPVVILYSIRMGWLVHLSQTTRSQHIQFHLPIDWRILGQNLHAGLHWSQKGYSWFWEVYNSNMHMGNCYSIGEKVANSNISICMYVCTVYSYKWYIHIYRFFFSLCMFVLSWCSPWEERSTKAWESEPDSAGLACCHWYDLGDETPGNQNDWLVGNHWLEHAASFLSTDLVWRREDGNIFD